MPAFAKYQVILEWLYKKLVDFGQHDIVNFCKTILTLSLDTIFNFKMSHIDFRK